MSLPKVLKSLNIVNRETSYANAILQAFIQLDNVQEWMKYLINSNGINNPFYNTSLTKEISNLLMNISNGINPDTSQIIQHFDMKCQSMWNKIIPQDPYHFLHYFLKLLHLENNTPKNPNFDTALYHQQMQGKISNDIEMFKIFNNYLDQTQNSFISNTFNNIQKYVVNCPFCLSMFNYGEKKIIGFNLDQILQKRKQSNKILSLNECFNYSNQLNKINCQMCHKNSSFEFRKLYNSADVLIISFNRNNNNLNFKNDVKFYLDFDISNFLINENAGNKKYKLKSVVCRYDKNKYFSDVLINNQFYRFMDCKMGKDLKPITDSKELLMFQPQILFYEVECKNKMPINEIQNIPNMENMSDTMKVNLNLFTNIPRGFKMYNVVNFFTLKFLVIPQIWDHNEESAIEIKTQVSDNFTFEDAVNRFFAILQKPREAIKCFTINNIQLDMNSTQKLKDMNINENSVIHALKSDNFDELPLISC